jgi:hypothetical protein
MSNRVYIRVYHRVGGKIGFHACMHVCEYGGHKMLIQMFWKIVASRVFMLVIITYFCRRGLRLLSSIRY